ncbi:2Fe-2S iron-sulfur cluster-binding protein [Hydrogenivirga sp. 128-5-R1-1]|uniref:succinate dehydrogenase/fumarate reductase iron-sulfur subunit n=1 Tax=Hydrogenivirga sp. 128-5-R1-1 TaxID=392423 RepID=UPI00015F3683|nr:2Fe-2S iron-sulfur cluster-binding protein [Hydrogenivirga sp. 128-5-R1-1]EDP76587.1 fumarate reductase iron-sulfur subunit [Hydrogenivirga sp. 128-5-R1-1]
MKVKLRRFTGREFVTTEYEVETGENPTVLEILTKIKEELDPSLSFRAMCRASVCGTCAVKVNGEHRLACNTRVNGEEVLIEPVDGYIPIKDLVVSHEEIYDGLRRARVWFVPREENLTITPQELNKTSRAWDCILCGICNNVCPPLLEKRDFGGPSLFTKIYRILEDPRDSLGEERLNGLTALNAQNCVHCSNCNLFCPKGCMPERWITVIEGKLTQKGYIQKKTEDFGFLGF